MTFLYKYRILIMLIVTVINTFLGFYLDMFLNPQKHENLLYFWFLPSYLIAWLGFCFKEEEK